VSRCSPTSSTGCGRSSRNRSTRERRAKPRSSARVAPLELDGTQATTLAAASSGAGPGAPRIAAAPGRRRRRGRRRDRARAHRAGAAGARRVGTRAARRALRPRDPKSFNTAGPGYLAYIPGGGLFSSAVAALIADAVNRYVGGLRRGPALTQLETNVVRWFARIGGLPSSAGGVLTTGGSLAGFSAVVRGAHGLGESLPGRRALRQRRGPPLGRQGGFAGGFPARAVRVVPTDAEFRVRLDALLAAAIAEDGAAGCAPACWSATRARRTPAPSTTSWRSPNSRRGSAVVSRRRGVRRVLPAHRARTRDARRHRARRLDRARSAQRALPALRRRLLAGARRRDPAPLARLGRRLPARHAGRSRRRGLLRDLARALARLPGAAGLAADQAPTGSARSARHSTRSSTSPPGRPHSWRKSPRSKS
jgi:hypothetical protein